VKGTGRGAVLVTLLGQWGKYLVQIAGLVILSRLLSPDDFGLVAMATVVIGIALVFSDFGLSLAAVQAETVSDAQKNNLFWINTAVGVGLAAVVVALSWPISLLYAESALQPVLCVMSLALVFGGIGVQFRTQINRDSRFRLLAIVDFTAQLAGFVFAVVGVLWFGFGYWSLALMPVVISLATTVILAVTAKWWPGLPRRGVPMRAFLTFGGHLLATQVFNYISLNLDQALVGRVWGTGVLGLYNRALQVARVPLQQIASPLTRVMLPYLARQRAQREQYLATLTRVQTVLSYALISLMSVLIAAAEPFLTVILGEQWGQAAPILQVLALAGAIQAAGYLMYWIALAEAATKRLLACESTGRVLMIVLMLVGAPFGPIYIAAASVVGQIVILIAGVLWLLPQSRIPGSVVLLPVLRAGLLSLSGLASSYGVVALVGDYVTSAWVRLVIVVAGWVVGAAAAALLVRPTRRDLASVLQELRDLRRLRSN
jgi:PST family polysaccharide transporter